MSTQRADTPANKTDHLVPFHPEDQRAAADRTERLMRVTAAIAEAVTPERVYRALVEEAAESLGASSAGLWLRRDAEGVAYLARSAGYSEKAVPSLARLPLVEGKTPAVDALLSGVPTFLDTQAELLERYPHLSAITSNGRNYRIAALPLLIDGRAIAVLGLTFDDAPALTSEARELLLLVSRYGAQAVERLRLLEAEREARTRAEALYRMTAAANAAEAPTQVFDAALSALGEALGTERSAILAYDADGVMRFKAWRGLSDGYRATVEGHSPWPPDVRNPQIVSVPDAAADESLAPYRALFASENIGALHFIPLVASGRLLGKFMVYYPGPRALTGSEQELSKGIAAPVAEAIVRFGALDELRRSVRLHEMFTGILSHDLRNPLSAIVNATQLALARNEDAALTKPLSRIMSSSGRMTRLIDQLLDFTRVRLGGGLPVTRSATNVLPALQQMVEELGDANASWKINLSHRGDMAGMWDLDRLSQVFSNLIANAGQHGTTGAPIEVSADGTRQEELVVTVRNAGVIPATRLAVIFEPLARREGSLGLGLGLYIAREIVRAHGGAVGVTSDETSGTTFRVSLPRHPDDSGPTGTS